MNPAREWPSNTAVQAGEYLEWGPQTMEAARDGEYDLCRQGVALREDLDMVGAGCTDTSSQLLIFSFVGVFAREFARVFTSRFPDDCT